MIHDLNETLKNLIYGRGKIAREAMDITFEQPTRDWSATLNRPTLNCWLFDLRENTRLRSMEVRYERNDAVRTANRQVAALRFGLTYLVSAWANRIEDEHLLLWRALAVLSHIPLLRVSPAPEPELKGDIARQPYDIPMQVGQTDELGINMTDLWSVVGNDMHAGFFVTATLALERQYLEEMPQVRERTIAIGQRGDGRFAVYTDGGGTPGQQVSPHPLIALVEDLEDEMGQGS
jgi:hypothetical protein